MLLEGDILQVLNNWPGILCFGRCLASLANPARLGLSAVAFKPVDAILCMGLPVRDCIFEQRAVYYL